MFGQVRLAWRLLRDERVTGAKFLLLAMLALYVASPIDAIPDLLLGVGQLDDVGIAIALIMVTLRLLPKLAPAEVVEEHLRQMRSARSSAATQPMDHAFDAPFTVR
jgi:uncharacterized membrane protein YkvA (DUF1232 family)